jgi:hypothetical protein
MATEGMRARGVAQSRGGFRKIIDFVSARMGCGRGDDVVTGAYNMPEPRSARTSAATSSRRWGEGTSGTTTLPRHDSSLQIHRSPSVQLRQGQTTNELGAPLDSVPEQTNFVDPNAYTAYGAYTQGEGSQPYPSTRGISMPEETRLPEVNQYTGGDGSQQVLMSTFLLFLQ